MNKIAPPANYSSLSEPTPIKTPGLAVGQLLARDVDETGELIDWHASRTRADESTRSFRMPLAQGTRAESNSPRRPQFARSESTSDEMRLEAVELLLENDTSELDEREHGERGTNEDQDWDDDYTIVEVALFLQPAW